MKIAFVHYHLKTGGVTTVLKRQIAAIQGACETLVLTGDRAATELPCKVVEIPELGYDQPGVSPPAADSGCPAGAQGTVRKVAGRMRRPAYPQPDPGQKPAISPNH